MLNKDYTAKLLNPEDVIITDVKNTSNNDQRKHDQNRHHKL